MTGKKRTPFDINELHTETLGVRAGVRRTEYNEHAEAMFLTSSFCFESAEDAIAAAKIGDERLSQSLRKKIIEGQDYLAFAPKLVSCATDVPLPKIKLNIPEPPKSFEKITKFKDEFNLGASVGITSQSYASCVNNSKYSGWVQKIEDNASSKNVNATPTVFVNGKELDRNTQYMDAAKFKAALAAAGVK